MKDTIYLICTKNGVKRMRIANGVRWQGLKIGEVAIKVNVDVDNALFSKEVPEMDLVVK